MLMLRLRGRLSDQVLWQTIVVLIAGATCVVAGQQTAARPSRLLPFALALLSGGLAVGLGLLGLRIAAIFRLFLLFDWLDVSQIFIKLGNISPALAMTGLPDLIVYILAAMLIARSLINRETSRLGREDVVVVFGMALFLCSGFLAATESSDVGIALGYWTRVCLLAAATLYLTIHLVRRVEHAELLILYLVAGMIVLGLVSTLLSQFDQFYATSAAMWTRLYSRIGGSFKVGPAFLFAEPVTLGEYSAAGVAISLAYTFRGSSGKVRWGALLASVILAVVLVLTNSRGPMLALGLATVTVIIASRYAGKVSLLWQVFGLLVLIPAALGALLLALRSDESGMIAQRLAYMQQGILTDPNLVGRTRIWEEFWPIYVRTPLGMGFWTGSQMVNLHDAYIWMLLGTGTIGALGLAMVLAIFLRACLRGLRASSDRQRTLSVAALGFIVVYMVSGASSILIFEQYKNIALWVVVGAVLGLQRSGQEHLA